MAHKPGWHDAAHRKYLEREFNLRRPHVHSFDADKLRAYQKVKKELYHTWEKVSDILADKPRLTERQVEFCRLYALSGRTKASHCMRAAGYKTDNDGALYQDAQRLLQRPIIQRLIRAFEMEEKARVLFTIEDVALQLQEVAKAAMEAQDFNAANKSLELLGKYLGMFVERKEILHKVVHNQAELDARIIELQNIIDDAMVAADDKLLLGKETSSQS
jgi:hypothetical protein